MSSLNPCRAVGLVSFAWAIACAQSQSTLSPARTPLEQTESAAPAANTSLPDVVGLMRDVEINQRQAESLQKDYIYHSVVTEQETNNHGQIRKTTVTESDVFWLNGVPVRRVLKKDGKALNADEIAKENQRIDKMAATSAEKREKADAEGKPTDPRGNDEVTVSRMLELGAFTNPRRVVVNGRPAIAVDFVGDPKAKTHNRAEDVIRDLAGTAWIDEKDHVLARAEGHFVNSYKIGGGLIASVQKDTRFSMSQLKVNGEVWLPSHLEGEGALHALIFVGFSGKVQVANSDYRKFRAKSTVLSGDAQGAPSDSLDKEAHP